MSWVNGVGAAGPVARGPARTASSGAGFSIPAGRASAAGTGGAAGIEAAGLALGGMLALQEAESGSVRDREARRHGQDMLAELLRLQRALLDGGQAADPLRRLASLASTVPEAADPRLRQAVAEVALRARVELARHETITSG